MTSHELAQKLLKGPDLPVELAVSDPLRHLKRSKNYPKFVQIAETGDQTLWVMTVTTHDETEPGIRLYDDSPL